MFPFLRWATLCGMQLIQIGEVRQKTVLDMIQEMADRQAAEMEQLKAAALGRSEKRIHLVRRRCRPSR